MRDYYIIQGERLINALELLGLLMVLLMALLFQFVLDELPCPLCLLQRIGFLGISLGFLLNLRFGLRPSHYAVSVLSALFTAFVALRQIALHAVPGTGSYGPAIFDLHMYTWSFIIAMLIAIFTTLSLAIDRQYKAAHTKNIKWKYLTHILFGILVILTASNAIGVLFECGISQCPDNPSQYRLLEQIL